MLGKIIGGFVGAKASQHVKSVGGKSGMVLGALAFPVIRRMRVPSLLALGAGGYVAKRLIEKNREPVEPSGRSTAL